MALAASRRASSLLTLVVLVSVVLGFLAGHAAATGKTGQVTVFWGRNKAEGSLREACDTGTYTIVVISFLNVFGHGRYGLDISGHPVGGGLGADIKHCQSNGHLVYLSVGGFSTGSYSLPTPQAAVDFADHLWFSYLAGSREGVHRPFGDAYVDGIDFFIENGSPDNYDVLARRLWSYNKGFRARTPVQLMATPGCKFPDRRVNRALATGLVGRINVRVYGDGYCAAYWQLEWDKWTKAYPDSQIYVGLPASEQTVGYVHPKNLFYGVVPVVQKAANYGGIMIWERFADKNTNYSSYATEWA